MGGDRTPPVRRTTVAEAAEYLGISAEAVRGRIRRGTLPVEREGGTVYVLLEVDAAGRTTADQPRTTADRPSDRTDALLAAYRDRVEDLREQLQAERQAHADARRLLAAALERIPPQLVAPSETSEAPETDDLSSNNTSQHVAEGTRQEVAGRLAMANTWFENLSWQAKLIYRLSLLGLVLALLGLFIAGVGGFTYSVISAINGDQAVTLVSAGIGLIGTIGALANGLSD